MNVVVSQKLTENVDTWEMGENFVLLRTFLVAKMENAMAKAFHGGIFNCSSSLLHHLAIITERFKTNRAIVKTLNISYKQFPCTNTAPTLSKHFDKDSVLCQK